MSASAGTAVPADVVVADDAASFGAVNLDAVVGCASAYRLSPDDLVVPARPVGWWACLRDAG